MRSPPRAAQPTRGAVRNHPHLCAILRTHDSGQPGYDLRIHIRPGNVREYDGASTECPLRRPGRARRRRSSAAHDGACRRGAPLGEARPDALGLSALDKHARASRNTGRGEQWHSRDDPTGDGFPTSGGRDGPLSPVGGLQASSASAHDGARSGSPWPAKRIIADGLAARGGVPDGMWIACNDPMRRPSCAGVCGRRISRGRRARLMALDENRGINRATQPFPLRPHRTVCIPSPVSAAGISE
jgi:hypothetical protein